MFISYLLHPTRVLLEKLIVTQLVKKFPAHNLNLQHRGNLKSHFILCYFSQSQSYFTTVSQSVMNTYIWCEHCYLPELPLVIDNVS
jgi:hypothetical protein